MDINLTLTKKQKLFHDSNAFEVLFGGAAGGGKSYGQIADAYIHALLYPGIKQLMLRRTFPELDRSLIRSSLEMFDCRIANYNQSKHLWRFANGSTIEFGCCDSNAEVTKYQSAEYDIIRLDELTHFTQYQYLYLMSRLRGANNFKKQMKSTSNPGGRGHGWVKERFISMKEPYKEYGEEDRKRVFIPANVKDNDFLMSCDPDYIKRLENLPENDKKALLYGDWEIFKGQVFTEWKNDPEGYLSGVGTHVVTPFEIPRGWRRFRSFDFGYSKPFCVQWWAVDYDGKVYMYRELYGCTEEADTGVKWTPSEIAVKIKGLEKDDPDKILGIADPSIYDRSRGESVAEMMEREGVFFEPADNTRLAGKMQLHYRLAFDEERRPGMYIFASCKGFIRTLPSLCYDDLKCEDVDTKAEDHPYDAARYFLMTHPVASKKCERQKGYMI
ncbi:MAG: phage terminase large subunit [Bacillota bacterium]|nr:phage terminase large subunit [Bacillota bacterium]